MKVLTAAEMREADRLTIERGIPGLILMENAGMCVVDFLCKTFKPLRQHRVAVICGKGNIDGATKFHEFVSSEEGRAIMRHYGFLLPGESLASAP